VGEIKFSSAEKTSTFKTPRNPTQTEAPDYPVGRSLAGLLLDVLLALALTIEPGFFHRLAASALNVSNSDVRGFSALLA